MTVLSLFLGGFLNTALYLFVVWCIVAVLVAVGMALTVLAERYPKWVAVGAFVLVICIAGGLIPVVVHLEGW